MAKSNNQTKMTKSISQKMTIPNVEWVELVVGPRSHIVWDSLGVWFWQ